MMCLCVSMCEMWYGMLLFVLCCFCYNCLCASCVLSNALLYGVFCCVLLYSCVLFGLTNVVVCLVCELCVMLSGLRFVICCDYVGGWGGGGVSLIACLVCWLRCDGVWCLSCVLCVCV